MKTADSALELLVSMLEIPSVSGHEQAHAEHLVARMQAAGFTHAEVDGAGNAVGVMGDGPRQLVLLGHQDTVPGEVPVRRDGDLLYGRGAVDAKGPLAAFASAVARVGPRDGWQLVVIGAVEEEAPTSKGARFVAPRYQPEACVIGEPSSWRALTLGYKGRHLIQYRLRQALSHSAGPEQAPPEYGVAFWQRLTELAQARNASPKVFEQVSPALLRFDTPPDGSYQRVELDVSVRTPLDFDFASWEAALREAAGDAELTFLGNEVAYKGGKNNPLVRAFLASIRALGGKPTFKVKTGTADLNVVGPVWQCPILAYGPGDSALDHTPNEHIDVAEYERGVQVLVGALEALTQNA